MPCLHPSPPASLLTAHHALPPPSLRLLSALPCPLSALRPPPPAPSQVQQALEAKMGELDQQIETTREQAQAAGGDDATRESLQMRVRYLDTYRNKVSNAAGTGQGQRVACASRLSVDPLPLIFCPPLVHRPP